VIGFLFEYLQLGCNINLGDCCEKRSGVVVRDCGAE